MSVAKQLHIAPATVRRHLRSVLDKLEGSRRSSGPGRGSGRTPSRAAVDSREAQGLRKLLQRGGGESVLAHEVMRAARGRYALTAMVLIPESPPAIRDFGGGLPRRLARTPLAGLCEAVRRADWVLPWAQGRYLVLLPGSDLDGARAAATRLRAAGRDLDLAIGAAQWQPGERGLALVGRAERQASLDAVQRQAERSLRRAAVRGG